MTQVTVSATIDGKVAERAMLKHPFYQAWTEGRLSLETLRAPRVFRLAWVTAAP